MREDCFVDTSFFKAYADTKDDFHQSALQVFQKLKDEKTQLITSNYILDETFTVIRTKCGLASAKQFKSILEEFATDLKIVRIFSVDDANAWEWFLKDWGKLSFTDCVSFALMKRRKIKRVATFDTDFKRAGFQVEV